MLNYTSDEESEASDSDGDEENDEEVPNIEELEEEYGYHNDMAETGGERSTNVLSSEFNFQKAVDYTVLTGLVCNLNHKQRVILQHCITYLFNQDKFYVFLAGGAGTGKSRVISTLYQVLLKIYNPREIAERLPVLISAYTGKAAFNVRGSLPFNI